MTCYVVLYVLFHNVFIVLSLTILKQLKNSTKQNKSNQYASPFQMLFDTENMRAKISSHLLLLAQSVLEKLNCGKVVLHIKKNKFWQPYCDISPYQDMGGNSIALKN